MGASAYSDPDTYADINGGAYGSRQEAYNDWHSVHNANVTNEQYAESQGVDIGGSYDTYGENW